MQTDVIFSRARADLVMATEHGDEDVLLWEHSVRVAQSARRIAELPVVQDASADRAAIVAAALYHDAGWIAQLHKGEIQRNEILLHTTSEIQRDQGALMLERSLAGMLPRESLLRAVRAVRTYNDRDSESIDAQVVCEADNLDEFGVLSIWLTVRRGVIEGKAVQALIDTWHRRKEYRFWEARLNDSFRFAAVRRVAEKRLEQFEHFMEELERQHKCADFAADLTPGPADRMLRSTTQ